MDFQPAARRSAAVPFVAAAVATLITAGTIGAVTGLFQSRGLPLEALAVAQRACASHTYVSERDRCVEQLLAATRPGPLAQR